jgi:hypothetical protein
MFKSLVSAVVLVPAALGQLSPDYAADDTFSVLDEQIQFRSVAPIAVAIENRPMNPPLERLAIENGPISPPLERLGD